jgi:D-alanyl-D-alanine carboxypeptidase
MMTACCVLQYAEVYPACMSWECTVSANAAKTIGTSARLKKDQTIRVDELFYALMLPSGNDAAVVLAETFGHLIEQEAQVLTPWSDTHIFLSHSQETEKHWGADRIGPSSSSFSSCGDEDERRLLRRRSISSEMQKEVGGTGTGTGTGTSTEWKDNFSDGDANDNDIMSLPLEEEEDDDPVSTIHGMDRQWQQPSPAPSEPMSAPSSAISSVPSMTTQSASSSLVSFVAAMNSMARRLKMTDTRYGNPHGLASKRGSGIGSSARDQAKLMHYVMQHPYLRQVVRTQRRGPWVNTNKLLPNTGNIGVKTGITYLAGFCLASMQELHVPAYQRVRKSSRSYFRSILPADGSEEGITAVNVGVIYLGGTSSSVRFREVATLHKWSLRKLGLNSKYLVPSATDVETEKEKEKEIEIAMENENEKKLAAQSLVAPLSRLNMQFER